MNAATTLDTKALAQMKLEEKIQSAASHAMAVVERVQNEVPLDLVARADKMTFAPTTTAEGIQIILPEKGAFSLHRHARGQVAEKAGIPGKFLEELTEGKTVRGRHVPAAEWQRSCAADLLERHFLSGLGSQRHLVRTVKGQVRGFLSDRFRRLDARPLLDAFVDVASKAGAVPVDGNVSDVRVEMKAIIPRVYVPYGNEAVAFGLSWGTSDYGAAKHAIRIFLLRLWCLNGATTEDALSQVHLGSRISEDVQLSARTLDLDTRASISALKDVTRGLLQPAKIESVMAGIRAASEKEMTLAQLKSRVQKRLLTTEIKAVEEAWAQDDVSVLPAGDTAWRGSNALSWIAKSAKGADRKLELERLAGEFLNGKGDEA